MAFFDIKLSVGDTKIQIECPTKWIIVNKNK